ncbi:uncharacterized protein BDV14DRAFT_199304 [Aspergillus stella-maris]|uniref:uncharacterized protein n=1 Tax=Aspergillus stella-maris TaxID=1810926 RepID=UPI003CCD8A4F
MSFTDLFNNVKDIAVSESGKMVNKVTNMATSYLRNTDDWNKIQCLQARRAMRDNIIKTFDRIYYFLSTYIDSETARDLDIKILTMDLTMDGTPNDSMPYFRPFSLARLNLHQVDPSHRPTRELMTDMDEMWTAAACGAHPQAEVLATALCRAFAHYERIKPDESYPLDEEDREYNLEDGYNFQESYTLEEVSGWKRMWLPKRTLEHKYLEPSPSNSDNADDNNNAFPPTTKWSYSLTGVWMRDDYRPHLKLIMHHDMPPCDDLLAGEIMAVLAMVRSRLSGLTLQEHNIIPVTMVSCMNEFTARVSQAYYSEEELIVFKSKLYHFDDKHKREDHINLFMLYLASEPVGDTVG